MGGYERRSQPWTATRVVVRRDPGGLQRPAAARGLGAVRGDRRQRPASGCRRWQTAGMRRFINGPEAFTPDNEFCLGRDRGRRLLRRGRLLRARDRGRRWHRQGDGRVDRVGRARHGPVAHGRAPVRGRVPLAVLHAGPHRRELRDLLRHPLPEPRAQRRPAAARVRRVRRGTRCTAPCSGRSRAGSGSNYYSCNEDPARRAPGGRAAGPAQHWSTAIVAEHARDARTTAALFDESSLRQARGQRS